MTRYFNFDRLINKYSCTFTVITTGKGELNDLGDWVNERTATEKTGAIMSISENKVYKSDGVLTEKDKSLFMKETLGDISKAYVLYDGNKYSVQTNPQNNPQFTGVWQYTLKWVSVFKEGDKLG